MAEKKIIGRVIQKHDVEANWLKATNFIPMQGEIIVYDIDANYSYERLKIGDGVKNVNALSFVDDALRETILEQVNSVDGKVNAISDLVGDTKVSDQINMALANSQSDWDVNDETSPVYIKNRPFYTQITPTTFVEQQSVTIGQDLYVRINATNMPFIVGQTYTVVFNGTQYECVAWNGGYSVCIGNGVIYGMEGMGGDEPFVCYSYGGNSAYVQTMSQGSCTISISGNIFTHHKIDEKYLPDLIGATGTEDGAEIFNDYENNVSSGLYSHAEGSYTTASGYAAHAEGHCTTASSMYGDHAEGDHTVANGGASHAEGYYTKAFGYKSHAEGDGSIASGVNAHAEGQYAIASGEGAHAEGVSQSLFVIKLNGVANSTTYEIVGGLNATTYKDLLYKDIVIYYNYPVHCPSLSISNNVITHITVDKSLSEYSDLTNANVQVYIGSVASGKGSHAEGMATIAASQYQHAQGKYNLADSANKYAHIVGNGTSATSRANAYTLDWNGNAWYAGSVYVGGTSQDKGSKLATETYVGTAIASIPAPDVSGQIANHNTSNTAHNDIRDAISALADLIGDQTVADQIKSAIENKAEIPKLTNVTLEANKWTGAANPWHQDVTMNGVTANSKIDLQPTAVQIVALQEADIMLIIENDNGKTTAYALGGKPTVDYTMQALITEVAIV